MTITIQSDGDQVCATWDSFISLAESHAGFGDTVEEAVNDLFSQDIETAKFTVHDIN